MLFLPLLFAEAQEGKKNAFMQLMSQNAKDRSSRNVEDRRRAGEFYLAFGRSVSHAVSALSLALGDADDEVRLNAALALAHIGHSARRATHDFIVVLEKDKLPDARIAAANALGAIYHDAPIGRNRFTVISALSKAMRNDTDTLVRHRACYAFRMIGDDAEAAAVDLLEIIQDKKEDPVLRDLACDSLGFVVGSGSKHIVPTLLEMYKKEDANWRFKGIFLMLLGKIGDKEEVVVPLLIDALAVKDEKKIQLRRSAVGGIKYLGPRGKAAVPALIEALDVSKFSDTTSAYIFQSGVLDALGSIGSDASAALPAIRKIADSNADSQEAAERALNSIEKKPNK